jgi:hypothetical protein
MGNTELCAAFGAFGAAVLETGGAVMNGTDPKIGDLIKRLADTVTGFDRNMRNAAYQDLFANPHKNDPVAVSESASYYGERRKQVLLNLKNNNAMLAEARAVRESVATVPCLNPSLLTTTMTTQQVTLVFQSLCHYVSNSSYGAHTCSYHFTTLTVQQKRQS